MLENHIYEFEDGSKFIYIGLRYVVNAKLVRLERGLKEINPTKQMKKTLIIPISEDSSFDMESYRANPVKEEKFGKNSFKVIKKHGLYKDTNRIQAGLCLFALRTQSLYCSVEPIYIKDLYIDKNYSISSSERADLESVMRYIPGDYFYSSYRIKSKSGTLDRIIKGKLNYLK